MSGPGTALRAEAVAALRAVPAPLPDAVGALGSDPGLYAWWAAPSVLPAVGGGRHPDADLRLLDTGAATMMRNRVTRQHLYRTGVSELRRTLAGLLLGELDLAPTWAADVVLPRADEERLTAWMRAHLTLTCWAHADRHAAVDLLPGVVDALDPGLRADTEPARSALARYTAAAGERTARVVGVPFRRP